MNAITVGYITMTGRLACRPCAEREVSGSGYAPIGSEVTSLEDDAREPCDCCGRELLEATRAEYDD